MSNKGIKYMHKYIVHLNEVNYDLEASNNYDVLYARVYINQRKWRKVRAALWLWQRSCYELDILNERVRATTLLHATERTDNMHNEE